MIPIASDDHWEFDHSDEEITLDRRLQSIAIHCVPFSIIASIIRYVPQNDTRRIIRSGTKLYQVKLDGCWLGRLGWQLAAKEPSHVLDHNADEQISIIRTTKESLFPGEFGGSYPNLEQCQQYGHHTMVSTCFSIKWTTCKLNMFRTSYAKEFFQKHIDDAPNRQYCCHNKQEP